MSHVIYILFSGLIVFVPQMDSTMKSFLVKDPPSPQCDHEPYLLVSGNFRVLGGSACRRIAPTLLWCDLTGTVSAGVTVELATKNGHVSLPPSPMAGEFLPHDIDDGGSAKWLLRMADIERGAAKVKTNLANQYDAEFDFGWNAASTCVFDEEERPMVNKRVIAINFKDARETIFRTQAVAERVMFTSSVSSDKPILNLRRGDTPTTIELDCSAGTCPILKFSNNVEQDTCTAVSHFEHYSAFSNSPGRARAAERVSGTYIDSIAVTAGCVGDSGFPDLLNDPAIAPSGLRGVGSAVQPKPSDRLICPPIVMEQ